MFSLYQTNFYILQENSLTGKFFIYHGFIINPLFMQVVLKAIKLHYRANCFNAYSYIQEWRTKVYYVRNCCSHRL